ncbi:TIGR01458 family HAD-type hydrolase [Sulfurimonas sp. HSL-1716]|uniref:TIGR01458 family HAD-type hydrolase n=1 Tax=Hydrocurvibacter sulfurireducens TaxID=3131937 RepID=UPI0031FA3A77
MSHFKSILCDIGGVLYVGNIPIKGAIEAVANIKKHYPVRFLTNTTQKSGRQLAASLQKMGFDITQEEIITALDVTKMYLQEKKAGAYYLLTDDAKAFFDDLVFTDIRYVVVGDAQKNFSYENLNTAFSYLHSGATLLAAAKNRYFKDTNEKLSMDAGGFVKALEYAAQTKAKIIGKPSKEFYHLACEILSCKPRDCIMIGDDIESDIGGAKDAGLQTALVKTGKFRDQDLQTGIKADIIIDSIADFIPRV